MLAVRIANLAMRGLTLGSRFLLVALMARYLDLTEAGRFGLYMSGLMIGAGVLGFEFYTATSREILEPGASVQNVLRRHFGFLALVCVVIVPLYTLAHALSTSDQILLSLCFGAHLVLELLSQDAGRLLTALGRPMLSSFILFLRTGLWVWLAFLAYGTEWLRPSVPSLVAMWFAGSATGFLLGAWALRRQGLELPLQTDWQWLRTTAKVAAWYFVGALLFRVVMGGDRFVVNYFLSVDAVGLYAVHVSLALSLISVIESAVSVFRYPALVRAVRSGEMEKVPGLLRKFFVEVLGIVLVALLVAAVAYRPLLAHFARPEYMGNVVVFYLAMLGASLYCISMPAHYLLYALNADRAIFFVNILAAATMLLLCAILLPQWGLDGAGVALLGALAVIALARTVLAGSRWRRAFALR